MRKLLLCVAAAAAMAVGGVSTALAQGEIIIINNNAPGVGFNDPTPAAPVGGNPGVTLGQQRLNVFEFAADIWEAVLQPTNDIRVQAHSCRSPRACSARRATTTVCANFPGAEFPDMWYHSALANQLAGED